MSGMKSEKIISNEPQIVLKITSGIEKLNDKKVT